MILTTMTSVNDRIKRMGAVRERGFNLHIKILHIQRVVFDKLSSRFDLVAH